MLLFGPIHKSKNRWEEMMVSKCLEGRESNVKLIETDFCPFYQCLHSSRHHVSF